jgi:histidinol-phosphate phosphatase family protein
VASHRALTFVATTTARVGPNTDKRWYAGAGAPRAGLLLDRDGTLIVDHGHVGSIDRVDFIDGAPEAVAMFNRARIPVVVVTNQSGVARGLYGLREVEEVHEHIAAHLRGFGARIDMFLYCPYHPAGVIEAFARASDDRKPNPGMAHAAAAALHLDLTASWVVGDRPEDMGLADEIGAYAVNLGRESYDGPRVWTFATLAQAAPFILSRIRA